MSGLLRSLITIIVSTFFLIDTADSQAVPGGGSGAAMENVSVFFLSTNTSTGFLGSNTALTAGLNLSLRPFGNYVPLLELRGSYPLSSNSSAARELNVLGGPALRRRFNRFEPYADVLFGYGRVDYPADYIYNTYQYVRSSGFIYSPGGGLEYFLNNRLSFKADAQFQHWNIPVTNSNTAWARSLSLGVAYHFASPSPRHKEKMDRNDPRWRKVSEDYPGVKR